MCDKFTCYLRIEHYMPKNKTELTFQGLIFLFDKNLSAIPKMKHKLIYICCSQHKTSPQPYIQFCSNHSMNISLYGDWVPILSTAFLFSQT
jgi:hypothetical protein